MNVFTAPRPESIQAVQDWLSANNLAGSAISSSGDWISVESATVAQANALFNANFTVFKAKNSAEVIRTLSYSLPADVEEHLQFIYPTTQYVLLSFELSHRVGSFTDAASADSSGH